MIYEAVYDEHAISIRAFGQFCAKACHGEDFKETIELYQNNPDVQEYLESLIGEVVRIKHIKDMNDAFDADIRKPGGKTIMVWEK